MALRKTIKNFWILLCMAIWIFSTNCSANPEPQFVHGVNPYINPGINTAKTQWHYSPSPPKKLFQSWEPYNVTLIPPCKVNVESHGSFAKNHPEKIGTYHLIPSLWINNRPVWMQESEGGSYLRANTFGSWIICKCALCYDSEEANTLIETVVKWRSLPTLLGPSSWAQLIITSDDTKKTMYDPTLVVSDTCLTVDCTEFGLKHKYKTPPLVAANGFMLRLSQSNISEWKREILNDTNWNIFVLKSTGEESFTEKEHRIIERTSVILEKIFQFYDSMTKISNAKELFLNELNDVLGDQSDPEYENYEDAKEIEEIDPQNDVVHIMKHQVSNWAIKLNSLRYFVERKKKGQKCGVNIKDELSAAANLMENIFKQLESTNPKVAVEERTKIAQYLSKFIKGGNVASKQITSKMSLWGKELVDESGEKKHIGVQDGVTAPELCQQHCREIIDCSAWTYKEEEKACYMKSGEQSVRFHDSWNAKVWSGRLKGFETPHSRKCNMPKYVSCMRSIEEDYKLGTNAPSQSGIKSDDRQVHDLIDDEVDCFLEHCPWAPTVDLSREIKDLPLSVCLMLNLPTTANDVSTSEESLATEPLNLEPENTESQNIEPLNTEPPNTEDPEYELDEEFPNTEPPTTEPSTEEPLTTNTLDTEPSIAEEDSDSVEPNENCQASIEQLLDHFKVVSVERKSLATTEFEALFSQLKPEEQLQIEFELKEAAIEIQERVLDQLNDFTPGIHTSFYSKPRDLADPHIEVHTLKAYRKSYVREKTFKKMFEQVNYALHHVWPNLKAEAQTDINNSNFLEESDKNVLRNILNTVYYNERNNGITKANTQYNQLRIRNRSFRQKEREHYGHKARQNHVENHPHPNQFWWFYHPNRITVKNHVRNEIQGIKPIISHLLNWQWAESLTNLSVETLTASKNQSVALHGLLNTIGMVSTDSRPYLNAESSVFKITNSLLTFFEDGDTNPIKTVENQIDEKIMHLYENIDQQTESMTVFYQNLTKDDISQAKRTLDLIDKNKFYSILMDMKSVSLVLKVKNAYLSQYRDSCINSWKDLSSDLNMEEVRSGMNRITHLVESFCSSKANMKFCGKLLFNYILLGSKRNYVMNEVISTVVRSNFPQKTLKLDGLLTEYKIISENDKKFLTQIATKTSESDQFCHVTCALEGEVNQLANEYDMHNFTATNINLNDSEKKTIFMFFAQIGVKSHFSKLELRQCQDCYQRNVKCKGAESVNDEETGKTTMTSYERIDGLCQPRSVYFSGGELSMKQIEAIDSMEKFMDKVGDSSLSYGQIKDFDDFNGAVFRVKMRQEELTEEQNEVVETGRLINIHKRLNTIRNKLPLNWYHTSPDLVP